MARTIKFIFSALRCGTLVFSAWVIAVCPASAQSPGGVTDLKAWYITQKGDDGYVWRDVSGHKWPDFTTGSAQNLNFHPALLFNRTTTTDFPDFAAPQATVAGDFFPESDGPDDKDFLTFSWDKNEVRINYSQLATNYLLSATQRARHGTGEFVTPEIRMRGAVSFSVTKAVFRSMWGRETKSSLNADFDGYIPELLIYDRALNRSEAWKVQSYLAVKYGLTLDTSYVSGNGTVLWNIRDKDLQPYYHRVTAIGKDSAAAIRQPKSNSTYETDSYHIRSDGVNENKREVPADDSTTVKKNLTMGFTDKTMANIKEGSYFFWGDGDQQPVLEKTAVDAVNYPGLFLSARRYLAYNRFSVTQPVKVEIGGALHDNLYKPYDYLRYRYVLVWFKGDTRVIDSTRLFDYFSRNVFHEDDGRVNFYDNRIAWNTVYWTSSPSGKYYFTFGRIPLLRFYQVNGECVQTRGSCLAVLVVSGIPISPVLTPDPVEVKFKKNDPVVVTLSFTQGVPPYVIKVSEVTPQGLGPVQTIKLVTADLSGGSLTVEPPEGSIETDESGKDKFDPNDGSRFVFYKYAFNQMKKDGTYQVTISDKAGQSETLQVMVRQTDEVNNNTGRKQ